MPCFSTNLTQREPAFADRFWGFADRFGLAFDFAVTFAGRLTTFVALRVGAALLRPTFRFVLDFTAG
jgi:hypothetical protein